MRVGVHQNFPEKLALSLMTSSLRLHDQFFEKWPPFCDDVTGSLDFAHRIVFLVLNHKMPKSS